MTAFNPWSYREDVGLPSGSFDLTGFKVEATDGKVGKIDETSHEVGSSYLVVDTGPWILGKKVLLPAGTINNVDVDERTVYVDRTKHQIKESPELHAETYTDPAYREQVSKYCGGTYGS